MRKVRANLRGDMMRWIIRMGEIILKSRQVRRFMRKALQKHLVWKYPQ